jgi:hypothetical protein
VPLALAPRLATTTMPLMSSPATFTVVVANSRSCGACGLSLAPSTVRKVNDIAAPAAEIIAPPDCTCSEYSPGATPVSVNWPSLLVRDDRPA